MIMVSCLSCNPDTLPRAKPFPGFRTKFCSQDALYLLRSCTNFKHVKQIHARIIRNGLSYDQPVIANLLRLCSSYKRMDYATLLFHQIEFQSTFTWNLMIRGYVLNDASLQAIFHYNVMMDRGVSPDKFTFPFIIKACSASLLIDKGKEVHALVVKTGFCGDIYVQNTLMDFYFKCGVSESGRKMFEKMRARSVVSWTTIISGLIYCGQLDAARVLFDQMPTKNVVSWTAMIDGYVRNGQLQQAFELFRRMQFDDVRPNEFTLVSLLVASAELGSLQLGSWVHDFSLKNGFSLGVYLGTALINMYSKCGNLEEAKLVFNNMEVKSLTTWNSMITSLGVHGRGEEALALFKRMEMEKVQPNTITFIGVLCACVQTNNIDKAYTYFTCMTERYGIKPTTEHCACLIQLCNRAKMLEIAD